MLQTKELLWNEAKFTNLLLLFRCMIPSIVKAIACANPVAFSDGRVDGADERADKWRAAQIVSPGSAPTMRAVVAGTLQPIVLR